MTTPLPPQDPREPEEKLPGEAELAALYHQLPQSEPGPALDAAVLRAAAQALAPDEESPAVLRERRKAARERGDWVHPKPLMPSPSAASHGSGRKPRWLIALGTAASLVLAAGLAWHMREPLPTTPAPAATDSAAPAQATEAAALPPAAAPAAAMQPVEPMPPPPPEPPKQPPVVAQGMPEPTADPWRKAVADQGAERASSKAKVTGNLRRAAPAPMPAPPAALQEISGNAIEAAPVAAATMAAAPPAPAPAAGAITVPSASDTPAQELDKIQQLFKQGRADEARQRLAAFQHAHPQWDLPPELRAQPRKP
jgi:hypothetical protein